MGAGGGGEESLQGQRGGSLGESTAGAESPPEPAAAAQHTAAVAREGNSGKRPRQGLRFHLRSRLKSPTEAQHRGGRALWNRSGC